MLHLQDKPFPRPIYSPITSCSYSHPENMSPLLPLTQAAASKINCLCVLHWLAVTYVSVLFQRNYYHLFHQKHNRHQRKTVAGFFMGFWSFLFPFFFETPPLLLLSETGCAWRKCFVTSCLYFYIFLLEI